MTEFRLKRAYESADAQDGARLLVDRLWPRGVRKDALDAVWVKEAAPSSHLRTEWHHDPEHFEDFATAYRAELDAAGAGLLRQLRTLIGDAPRVTLVYAAKDPLINHAVVLRDWLEAHLG